MGVSSIDTRRTGEEVPTQVGTLVVSCLLNVQVKSQADSRTYRSGDRGQVHITHMIWVYHC